MIIGNSKKNKALLALGGKMGKNNDTKEQAQLVMIKNQHLNTQAAKCFNACVNGGFYQQADYTWFIFLCNRSG
jgi:hypothetical protein